MNKRRGLGSLGVDVLLSTRKESVGARGDLLKHLPIEDIRRGQYQPRGKIKTEDLESLVASIRAQGLVQPVVVRAVDTGYELIAGERRWRAAQLAGLTEIPALIKNVDDAATAAMSLIENIQRQDLNPLEEATALNRLLEEFNLTHQEVADAVGRSRAAVSNLVRLLDLEADVQTMLRDGKLEMGHARALLPLPAKAQLALARLIAEHGFSVRETERRVKQQMNAASVAPKAAPVKADPNLRDLERRVGEFLGAKVDVQTSAPGKGRLVLHYSSLDQLEGLLERMGVRVAAT